ncbi:NAD(P)-binding protein [Corynespora cassiicola Philippines]|uniref:NAD(P)-binding protein n=1 Tax=Corynespora cassiicola Philippines TaxID=1448308 RepID=A0A2T2NQJ0_CORCC|nr:NAD(P)-binding protein [Corynespora cassiicola Philippines]
MAPPTTPLNILITGGARGIGRGLSRHFLLAGHTVLVLDSNAAELQHVQRQAASASGGAWGPAAAAAGGDRLHTVLCDLRDRQAVARAVGEAERVFGGRLDVLVNNAFATPHTWRDGRGMEDGADEGAAEEIMEQWDEKIAVGLTAPFLLARLCVRMLRRAGEEGGRGAGCVVNVASTRAYQAEMDHEAYSAAKAGLIGLTRAMAVSLGTRHKIRVNSVVPGWIHVGDENEEADREGTRWEDGLGEEDHAWHPAGRVGKVEDVVKAVEYCIDNDFVTGQEVVVDGGVGRKMVYPE